MNRPHDYITALEQDSVEMKTAELLSGVDGAFLFKFYTAEEFKTFTIYLSEYRRGELISKEPAGEFIFDTTGTMPEGMIALVPDFEESRIKLIVTHDAIKYSAAIPILEDEENQNAFGRSAVGIDEDTPIRYGEEQGLIAFIYGRDQMRVTSVQQLEEGDAATENEYIYYFSVEFSR